MTLDPLARANMTTLECAVWAVTFTAQREGDHQKAIDAADQSVLDLRDDLAFRDSERALDYRRATHLVRVLQRSSEGVAVLVRCRCGYQPPLHEDPEEMMTLHLAHVRALGPDDKAIPDPEPTK